MGQRLNAAELREIVIDCILSVAPEAGIERLRPGRPWREQLEIDSFDFQNVLAALEVRTGITVPERDYVKLDTFEAMLAYLTQSQSSEA